MIRAGKLYFKIAEPDNLRLAYYKAQKGKFAKPEVQMFAKNLDKNLLMLREELLNEKVRVGDYHYFKIFDPKERLICASSFRERVLQHALMNVCHPVFESFQISDSYACRLNKGTFAAKEKAEYFQKQHRWFLKLDVRKYFDSVGHDILFMLLNRRFKDQKVLRLFHQIIQSYNSQRAYGVPIGNLTSQYFANHYLALADHFAKEKLYLKGYVRYMDDMVLWGNSRDELLDAGERFTTFINQNLQLQLKPPIINKVEHGLTFLGFRIFPDKTRLSQRSKKRFEQKLKTKIWEVEEGEISQAEFSQSVMALYGFIGHSHSKGYALKTLEKIRT